jgi:hypothetical protein
VHYHTTLLKSWKSGANVAEKCVNEDLCGLRTVAIRSSLLCLHSYFAESWFQTILRRISK